MKRSPRLNKSKSQREDAAYLLSSSARTLPDLGGRNTETHDSSSALASRHNPLGQTMLVDLLQGRLVPQTKVVGVLLVLANAAHFGVRALPSLGRGDTSAVFGCKASFGAQDGVREEVVVETDDDVAAESEFHGSTDGDCGDLSAVGRESGDHEFDHGLFVDVEVDFVGRKSAHDESVVGLVNDRGGGGSRGAGTGCRPGLLLLLALLGLLGLVGGRGHFLFSLGVVLVLDLLLLLLLLGARSDDLGVEDGGLDVVVAGEQVSAADDDGDLVEVVWDVAKYNEELAPDHEL
jgi:hypothetical protein